jgi:hypothetical protein
MGMVSVIVWIQAKKDLIVLFGALTQEERDGILDPKGKVASKDKKNASTLGGPIADVTESSTQSVNRQRQNHDNEDQQTVSHLAEMSFLLSDVPLSISFRSLNGYARLAMVLKPSYNQSTLESLSKYAKGPFYSRQCLKT